MKKEITKKEFEKLVKEFSKPAIDTCRQNGIKISSKLIKENTANELLETYIIEG